MGRRIKHTSRDVEELARLMLAEAIGEGVQGMNMVAISDMRSIKPYLEPVFLTSSLS
jgi:N-acetylmuramoyl-L-alanine amidase